MRALALALVAALAACSSDPLPDTVEPPDTFYIRRVDLIREMPNDFCRAENENFLSELIDRTKQKIAVDLWQTFSFEDFNVTTADRTGQQLAVLRFRVERENGEKPMMVAAGAFTREGCKIGPLKVAEGTSTAALD